ncbi:hypothetical protein BD413DRAFT_610753 [Trametes elegans]|nr:hypothetical protein BD413DRAFT_610753 [Trametes elegans]
MARYLPHDVLDDVFEFVSSPVGLLGTWRKDCLACTYVCKEWKYAAQAALYQHVGIPVKKRLSRFLTFLKQHPDIAAHIRTVSIWRYEDNRDKLGFPIRPVLLLKVLAALPKLRTLELFRVVLSGWPQSSPLPTTPTHLSTLKLIDLIVDFKGETDRCLSFDFLRLFSVDTLEVQGYDDEQLPFTPGG